MESHKRTDAVNEKMWNLVHAWDGIMTLASENGWTKEMDDVAKVWMPTTKPEDEGTRARESEGLCGDCGLTLRELCSELVSCGAKVTAN